MNSHRSGNFPVGKPFCVFGSICIGFCLCYNSTGHNILPFAEYEVLFGVVITFGGREISDLTIVRIYRVGIIRIILICSISVCIYSRFINEHHRTFAGTLDGEFHVLGAEGLAVFENILIASIREFERRIYSDGCYKYVSMKVLLSSETENVTLSGRYIWEEWAAKVLSSSEEISFALLPVVITISTSLAPSNPTHVPFS